MTRHHPQLSVIVLCLNEAARLPLLLADLQQSQFPLEILVSDGGSDDASPQIAELAGGRVIPVQPPGRGRQLAIAAGEARGGAYPLARDGGHDLFASLSRARRA